MLFCACLLLSRSVIVCLHHFISGNHHTGPWLDECLICIWVTLCSSIRVLSCHECVAFQNQCVQKSLTLALDLPSREPHKCHEGCKLLDFWVLLFKDYIQGLFLLFELDKTPDLDPCTDVPRLSTQKFYSGSNFFIYYFFRSPLCTSLDSTDTL